MKICHVITRLILGGAQENTILTCEGLHRDGHEVTLVTGPALGPEGELLGRAKTGGYRVVIIDEMRREIHPFRDRATSRRLREVFRELQPDVVHTHSSKAGIIARKVADKLRRREPACGGMKIVHTIHGLAYHRYESVLRNRIYIALEKRAARRSDAIICVADAMTRQALAAGVGKPEQYTTIYSGMEVEDFLTLARPADAQGFRASLGLPAGAVLVTQVSRLAELKGHDDIIAAAVKLEKMRPADAPPVHFCFVGDGHLRRDIEYRIHQAGLTGRFHLTGLLPPGQIPAVMHASDILVHCSYREGLARTLPQAMLARTPVISYDVDGASEVLNDQTGILLPPPHTHTHEEKLTMLAEAIDKLAADEELRRQMGTAGKKLCQTRFDQQTMVRQIEEVYEKCREER
ncbi:MAG: glycosyltransferase family 4 protein [Phycisphaerae bacterium]|nr:glycosyltransferase family 4 protein [Phycisphaerae bacterium]